MLSSITLQNKQMVKLGTFLGYFTWNYPSK